MNGADRYPVAGWYNPININKPGGSLTMLDGVPGALVVTSIALIAGTLDMSDFTHSFVDFNGGGSNARSLDISNATLNLSTDDLGLIIKRNGYEGYLASNKQGGEGRDDIYYFTDPDYFNRVNHRQPPVVRDHTISATTGEPPPVARTHTAEEEEDKRELEQLKFYYNYNSAMLLTESRRILDHVAAVLQRHPGWKVVIASFADSRGPDQYNVDLSAVRCYAVIDYLANKGIDPKRLYYRNKGEQEPVNGCKDGIPCKEDDYKLNRRSELKIKW